ncbi:MAG: ABC transporter ATP-binding protein [Chloroflexi bacterium]|nr:ABC transporter ATP-binding protein [Ardenticatenaceae bacterium]MBL1128728.1 ABC transporter ATP-binding protein [Chloroflexota bacterium]NOG34806.1 ABC transporter ATP-binding protein [Chloroflexota bacterium]GIK55870.1 MAG: ABC transporter ATP-binding protein [Chloroflexota bacterium]
MSEIAIRCENLSRRYGEVQALKPLNLDVPAGSIFGFLGRNGAGKTTTMRLLAGLARPSTGRAWIDGIETTQADSAARATFGYLPQDPAFYPWMSAHEYLNYVGKLFQIDKATRQRRADEVLALAGLTDAAKRPIRGYSGGMVQRLGVAQALLHNPPVLLLDEPTSALDPAGRYELLTLIESLRGRVTVFFSSHILGDVERICDTIAIIRQGELLLVMARDELLNQYAADVVELDLSDAARTAELAALLAEQPWVIDVTPANGRLRLRVNDVNTAKHALLPLLAPHGAVLERYEWVRPSLEEIFLALSE